MDKDTLLSKTNNDTIKQIITATAIITICISLIISLPLKQSIFLLTVTYPLLLFSYKIFSQKCIKNFTLLLFDIAFVLNFLLEPINSISTCLLSTVILLFILVYFPLKIKKVIIIFILQQIILFQFTSFNVKGSTNSNSQFLLIISLICLIIILIQKLSLRIKQLQQSYYLLKLGKLSSILAHELNSSVMSCICDLETQADLKKIKLKLNTIKNIINCHQNPSYKISLFSANQQITKVKNILKYKAKKNEVKIIIKKPKQNIKIYGTPCYFLQIIANLVSNAIESYSNETNIDTKNKKVLIEYKKIDNNLFVEIKDSGCGIPAKEIPNISQAFYSLKNNSDLHLGLGLSISLELLKKFFSGKFRIHSKLNKGTTIHLFFPLRREEQNLT